MISRQALCLAILTAVVIAGGCDPQFDAHGTRMTPNALTSPLQWKISSSGDSFKNLRFAIDGLTVTEATTKSADYRNASFTIDLGRECLFNTVVLLHGSEDMGFARQINVATSNDGNKFTDRYTGPGTRKMTYVPLMAPIRARYIRITAVQPGKEPWAISQVYLQ